MFDNRTDLISAEVPVGKLVERDEKRRAQRKITGVNSSDYSEALERGLAVLRAFDAQHVRMTQADLARKIDLPRATVRRSLMTLVHLGFLIVDGRTYQLTPKVLTLASAYLTTNPVSRVLQPVCEELCSEFGASCTVAVLDGTDAVMIARALPHETLSLGTGIGFRVPASHSALGRVLLSALEDDRRRAVIAVQPGDFTADTVTAPEQIEAAVAHVQEAGYAYVANEVEIGFHSVAVPLRRWDRRAIAALNLGTRVEHLSADDMRNRVRLRLQQRAEEVQSQLI